MLLLLIVVFGMSFSFAFLFRLPQTHNITIKFSSVCCFQSCEKNRFGMSEQNRENFKRSFIYPLIYLFFDPSLFFTRWCTSCQVEERRDHVELGRVRVKVYAECRDPFEQWLGEAENKLGQWRRMEKGMGEQIEKLKVHTHTHTHTHTHMHNLCCILCVVELPGTINQGILTPIKFFLYKILFKMFAIFNFWAV